MYVDGGCYSEPYITPRIAFLPHYDSASSSLTWTISGDYSELIDSAISNYLLFEWTNEDYILKDAIVNIRNSSEMQIDSKLMRDESIYMFNLSATNEYNTFVTMWSSVFAPISCMVWMDSETSTYINEKKITDPSGQKDVSYDFKLFQIKDQCEHHLFFDTFDTDITFYITPTPKIGTPALTITATDTGYTLLIPKAEQYKFDTGVEYSIVLTLNRKNDYMNSFPADIIF